MAYRGYFMHYAREEMEFTVEGILRFIEVTARRQLPVEPAEDANGGEMVVDATSDQAAGVSLSGPEASTSPEEPKPESSHSAASSENAAVAQAQTSNDVNTTLASQLASTSVTHSSSDLPAQTESSSSNQPSVIVSDIQQSDSQPSVIVSDIPESEGQPSIPPVIARDIVDLGNGQSIVLPSEVDLQSGGPANRTGQKRKAEESEDAPEKVPSPKEQKRGEDEAGEHAEEENGKEEAVMRLLKLITKYKTRDIPPNIEQQIRSLERQRIEELIRDVTHMERRLMMHSMHPYHRFHPEDVGPREPLSDEESDVEAFREDPQNPPPPAKFVLTNEQRLLRSLILGGETRAVRNDRDVLVNAANSTLVWRMIEEGEGEQVVRIIKEVSVSGRSARQDVLLYILAICCRSEDMKTKQAAYASVQEICRIPTHIFELIEYIEGMRQSSGWGRGLRKALCTWYNNNATNPSRLAMHVTKYRTRSGWSHRDVFRLAHIKPTNDSIGFIVRYCVKGLKEAEEEFLQDGYLGRAELEKVHKYLQAVEEAKKCRDCDRTVQLVQEHNLIREQLCTEMLNQPKVWSAMLPNMPLTALLRNLNKMTKLNLFSDPELVQMVTSKLLNTVALKKARVHPLKILLAHRVYKQGTGEKGSLTWTPHEEILATLDKAFYASFEAVEPTNKRILIALDVSGSMTTNLPGYPITVREAAVVMSMVTLRREPHCDIVGFHHKLMPLEVFKNNSLTLTELTRETEMMSFGATDCSKPMTWARKHNKEYDAFIIYTDSETNVHRIPPYKALEKYRERMHIPNAKLIVVGMYSSDFTIAQPNDLHMLDVVGFDPETPAKIHEFLMGLDE